MSLEPPCDPCPDAAQWQQALEGEVTLEQFEAMLLHAEGCQACTELSGSLTTRWSVLYIASSQVQYELGQQTIHKFEALAKISSTEAVSSGSRGRIVPPEIPGLQDLVEVGYGGMGVVFKAHEVVLGRTVAVKVLTMAGQLSPHAHARANREAQSLARLQHPHVVQIDRSGELAGGLPYLVMEWISGGTLQEQLDYERPAPLVAASILKDLAAAVAEAHAQGIIHRDLKPSNVLLASRGQPGTTFIPKLADFGLARPDHDDASLTESGVTMGTPSYMAPEQTGLSAFQAVVGPLTDIHGLGAILYALLAGQPPYQADSNRDSLLLAASGNYPAIDAQKEKIPRDLVTIMQKCLQTDPQRRYRTAQELGDELDRFLAGKPILARPISGPERFYKWALRHPVAAVLAVLFASATLAAIVGTAYHIRSMSSAMQKTQDALELASTRGQLFQESLSTFNDELIQRLMDRGSALNAKDRAFLHKIRELYKNAPAEADAKKSLMNQAVRLARLGGVFFQINQYTDASLCQQAAIDAYNQALELAPDDRELLKAKGAALSAFHSSLLRSNRAAEAEPVARQLMELQQKLANQDPFQQIVEAQALIRLGATLDELKRYEESREPMAQALQILEQGRARFSNDRQFWTIQCQSLVNTALSSSSAGRPEEFEARLRVLLDLVGQPIEKFPDKKAQFVELQSIALIALGEFYVKQNRLDDAEILARQLLQNCREAIRADPQNPLYREQFGDACGNFYNVCKALAKPQEAEADLLEALKRADEAHKAEPAIFDRSRALIFLQEQAADLFQRTGRPAEALAMNACVLESARPWLPLEGFAAEVRGNLALALTRLSEIYSELGNHAEAVRLLQEKVKLVDPEAQPQVQAQIVLEQLSDRADQVALDLPRLTGRPGSEP